MYSRNNVHTKLKARKEKDLYNNPNCREAKARWARNGPGFDPCRVQPDSVLTGNPRGKAGFA